MVLVKNGYQALSGTLARFLHDGSPLGGHPGGFSLQFFGLVGFCKSFSKGREDILWEASKNGPVHVLSYDISSVKSSSRFGSFFERPNAKERILECINESIGLKPFDCAAVPPLSPPSD